MSWNCFSMKNAQGRKRSMPQTRRVVRDFFLVLSLTTATIFLTNVAAAQSVPVPVFSLIVPFDFGLTESAIAAIHGGLAGGDLRSAAPLAGSGEEPTALAMTLGCVFFAALIAATLAMYRRLRSSYAWRWSTHFD